jgi:glycosyltransferase involved in cell wall biosynthesis
MKIALVTPFPERPDRILGGVAGAAHYLADELSRLSGVSVSIVVPRGASGRSLVREEWGLLEVYRLPALRAWRRLPGTLYDLAAGRRQVDRMLASLAPDIVHFNGTAFLAAGCRRRSVLTIHGIAEKDAAWDGLWRRIIRRPLLRVTEQLGRRSSPHVILISDAVRGLLPPEGRRFWRIDNPVAEDFFRVVRRPEPGRILCCSRLRALKNIEGLIDAFALLQDWAPGSELRLAGAADPGYREACERRAGERGVAGQTRFLGALSVPEVRAELASAACLALPSLQENAPLSVAEAMAAGVPVVATRVGGVPEMLEHGNGGLLVPPGDVPALAAALQRVLGDPEAAEEMGRRGQDRARERFRASLVARRTLQVYREIAGGTA